jgi:hypothetical protein
LNITAINNNEKIFKKKERILLAIIKIVFTFAPALKGKRVKLRSLIHIVLSAGHFIFKLIE